MADPHPLLPLPRDVTWTGSVWEAESPLEQLARSIDPSLPPQDYRLVVAPDGARLEAGSSMSLRDGLSTFGQLLGPDGGDAPTQVPGVRIEDGPAHAWRGAMIDVARHFMPLDALHRMVDALALHRMNILHLHLTDDQGWRVEIKGYPRLTEIGAWRSRSLRSHLSAFYQQPAEAVWEEERHGGFYTQDELRGLAEYAEARGVTVVPEVDLPGHVQAAVASYPELGATGERVPVRDHWGISEHVLGTSPQAFQFVEDVLSQMADVFPGPFVHIGGDECPVDQWRASADAQRHMLEQGFTREREIQGEFGDRARGALAARGKRMLGWDEILEVDAPRDTVAMVWRPDAKLTDATGRGFQAVNASSTTFYLDQYQGSPQTEPLAIGGRTTLEDVYAAEAIPASVPEDQRDLVLGVQGQLWTEYIPDAAALEYMAFPRLCALAEVAWGTRTSFGDFRDRLRGHLPRLERLGVTHRPLA